MPKHQAVVCSQGETKEMELYVGPFPEARLISQDGIADGKGNGKGDGIGNGNGKSD